MEERILEYLSRRAARPEHLERHLDASAGDVSAALDEMQGKGWINSTAAWFGNDPAAAITVISLTPAGRQEVARRQEAAQAEPIILTREELVSELRRLGLTDEQIALNPNLRGDSFHYWPSIPAWSIAP